MQTGSLANQLLIAMPGMNDPNFSRTVTYVCEHNDQGALGIVINRPVNVSLGVLFKDLKLPCRSADIAAQPVYVGGPMQNNRGFVLHRPVGHWDSTLDVTDQIGVTTSRDILDAMAGGDGPRDALVALGYAGWGAGQLEEEILGNTWLHSPASASILFELPVEQRRQAAAATLGIDLNLLSGEAGHA